MGVLLTTRSCSSGVEIFATAFVFPSSGDPGKKAKLSPSFRYKFLEKIPSLYAPRRGKIRHIHIGVKGRFVRFAGNFGRFLGLMKFFGNFATKKASRGYLEALKQYISFSERANRCHLTIQGANYQSYMTDTAYLDTLQGLP